MSNSVSGLHHDITDVPGVTVGHASDMKARTGVTVVLAPPEGARAGMHIGGSAASTRQADSLRPEHVVDRVHGICLCGGSGRGLDAAGGVQARLEEAGVGIRVVGHTIPIVPAAALFDLNFGGSSIRPDVTMGYDACRNASGGPVQQGSVGAGTGATIGKLFGVVQAMKGGVGSASVVCDGLIVGALVVLNAFGDIRDPHGNLIAGARTAPQSLELADARRLLTQGTARSRQISVENTTLSVVAVNANADKITASRIAAQAALGLGRVISPFQSQVDGDLTIVLCTGNQEADADRIALLASDVLQAAVVNAVRYADGFGLLPAWKDLGGVAG
ncbi:MAG: P1 family peptidase [Desulfomonilaceae bacterium]|nr:P1 family peptidase [Desulfomonilaceae bacterium]